MISSREVERKWQEQSRLVDVIQYQYMNGFIDQEKYYTELQRVGDEAASFEREYFEQFNVNNADEMDLNLNQEAHLRFIEIASTLPQAYENVEIDLDVQPW